MFHIGLNDKILDFHHKMDCRNYNEELKYKKIFKNLKKQTNCGMYEVLATGLRVSENC